MQPLSGRNTPPPSPGQFEDSLSLMELAKQLRTTPLGTMDLNQIRQSDLSNLQRLLTPKMTKYIPHVPTPKQAAFLLLNNKEAFYGGSAGGGKALSLTEEILTDSGWKPFGQLTLSDRVLAGDGTWTEIEYITDTMINHPCYEILFNTGETIVADAEHLWSVSEYKNRSHWVDSIVTTAQLKPKIKLCNRAAIKGELLDLGIDPYLFGYWLGDGNAHTGSITCNDEDLPNLLQYAALHKYESTPMQYTVEGLTEQLRRLGVLRDKQDTRVTAPETKHIPEYFFFSSIDQRLALLQGLMDSDGSIQTRGRCEITLREGRLADDIGTLLASLGIVYSRTMAPTTYNGRSFPSHRYTFSTAMPVFRLARKKQRLPKVVMNNRVLITEVKKVSSVPVRCIRVKHPSRIFLVGRTLIPTHNSDALLMGGLQYVDVKGYAGIIFRKTYADLTKPGALIDRAKEWLFKFEDVRWNEKDKKFEFFKRYGPHKEVISILQFGYLENANDKYNYQGGEYQYIGFDELTHIDLQSYLYMFSRLRRLKGSQVPLRVRGASNPPDDDSGLWVKTRFIDEGPANGRIFIPAGMDDNPYLDVEQYEESLAELDPVTRARLRDGNWEIVRKGNMFKREWFQPVDKLPPYRKRVRFWDMAATDEEKAKKRNKSHEADYTVGFLMSMWNGIYYIEDIIRVRKRPADTEELQKLTAQMDTHSTIIREEREPGSAGIGVIDTKKRNLLSGYDYDEYHSTGSKTARANPFSAAAERGQVKYLLGCRNIQAFFDEAESFPGGLHDDIVDAGSGAFSVLDTMPSYGEPITVLKDENRPSTWADEFELAAGYFTQDFNRMR